MNLYFKFNLNQIKYQIKLNWVGSNLPPIWKGLGWDKTVKNYNKYEWWNCIKRIQQVKPHQLPSPLVLLSWLSSFFSLTQSDFHPSPIGVTVLACISSLSYYKEFLSSQFHPDDNETTLCSHQWQDASAQSTPTKKFSAKTK